MDYDKSDLGPSDSVLSTLIDSVATLLVVTGVLDIIVDTTQEPIYEVRDE